MRHNSAGMIFIHSEWEYCKKIGKLQVGFEDLAKEISFEISPGRVIKLVTTYCCLEGLCTYPEFRPLICRFYPFFPRVSVEERKVTGYVYGSVLDQYWDSLGVEHPCYLRRSHEELCMEAINRLEPLLQNPALLFYFKAIEIVAGRVLDDLKAGFPEIFSLPPKEFFQRWEIIYLTGRAFNVDGLREDLANLDQEVQQRYEAFEL